MKHQQFCRPRSGKLVFQLPGGVTFAYDLHLGRSRDRWKGLAQGVQYWNGPRSKPMGNAWVVAEPKKCRLVPQNGPRSLGPKKS